MLTVPGLGAICRFLGIADRAGGSAVRVHQGPALAMRPRQVRRARAWLAPQYDFVSEQMGRLPQTWLAAPAGV